MSKEVKEVVTWENNEFGTKDMLINGAIAKPIYGGKYYASYDGFIYSNLHKDVKKLAFGKFPCRNSKGNRTGDYYYSVSISCDGKETNYPVHRLIAMAFLENPNNLRCVNHKDGNKQNNHVDNLEWCTNGHNVRHAYKNGLINLYRKGNKCKKCGDKIGDNNKSGYCQKCNKELKKSKGCPTSTANTGRAIAQ